MPPATPNITLTVTLVDYSGAELGAPLQPAWVRVALSGFGPTLPAIPGTAMVGKISSWFVDIPYLGTPISVKLWGNDQITPSGTYYAISILDTQKNVIECAAYQFTGGPLTVDLSNAVPLVPPFGFDPDRLEFLPCTGPVPGSTYVASGRVIAPALNGILLPEGVASPVQSYTLAGDGVTITLNFTTESGDLVYALCVS